MAPAPTPDPGRRDAGARERVLAATTELLAEQGFARTGIEAIARRAGVGKQTIYRWWPTKAAVVLDALDDALGPAGPLPDTGELRDDLVATLRGIVDELADPRVDRLQRTVTAEVQHDPALAAAVVERVLRPQTAAVADRLRAAQGDGQVAADRDVDLAVELLVGPLFHRWLLRTAPLDHAYADALVDQALRGLR